MKRRTFLQGTAAVAAASFAGKAPAIAQANRKVIKAIPLSNLSGIDPVVTSGQPVRNHGYHIYDTLFGMDEKLNVKPQMADGYEVSSDKLTWTIKLRDGLKFHDKEAVLAKDCVASIKRWGTKDPLGQTLMGVTNELTAVDDKTLRFRLKSPFGLVAHALGKVGGPGPFILPERLASTDSSTAIKDTTGSGPYRFVTDEWVPGSRIVYAKNEDYVPRNEAPSCTAGGKKVYVDRFEWVVIPDAATATAAIQRGEVDWYQSPDLSLLPLLKQDKNLNLAPFDEFGYVSCIRFNHLQPPFDKPLMRQAIMAAVKQVDYLQAQVGDPTLYKECKSLFFCGTESSTGAGNEVMVGNFDKAKEMIKQAGYNGERVVMLSPTDLVWLHNASLVTADLLKRLGVNAEIAAMDLATFYSRRNSMEPVDKGGWSILHAGFSVTDILDPSVHLGLRAHGKLTWPGWPTDAELEKLRADWLEAGDAESRIAIAKKIEARAFITAPFVPLGQFQTPSAMRNNVTGMLKGPLPIAWNLQKA